MFVFSKRQSLTITSSIVAASICTIWVLYLQVSQPVNQVALPTDTKEETAPATREQQAIRRDLSTAALASLRLKMSGSVVSNDAVMQPLPAPVAGLAESGGQITYPNPRATSEVFSNKNPNRVQSVINVPVSTFSIDVDTASYGFVRSSLQAGIYPTPDAVRVEEMVNYFPYEYDQPNAVGHPFAPTVSIMQTPWNNETKIMRIGIQGQQADPDDRPALNLVFLIDTSGSMGAQNKLPLLIQSFKLMLSRLNEQDEISIVTYAGSAGEILAPTAVGEADKIISALENLSAGGSTAGQAGLQQAYGIAAKMAKPGEVSRVILATDGDFNVGVSDPVKLTEFIAAKRDAGTYLSVVGFGRGNINDAIMQSLAQNGNGNAMYIDTLSEAQKAFGDELASTVFPIADDVKIQVEFNPAEIAEYRLIGYETRALQRSDFNNDAVDAGEVGAGHSVTALYEITPVGSAAILNDPLRYGSEKSVLKTQTDEIAYVRLRYKAPGSTSSKLIETPVRMIEELTDDDTRFAVAIAGFGQFLRDPKVLNGWGYPEMIAMANAARGRDAFGYRAEAVNLMRLAQSLSGS